MIFDHRFAKLAVALAAASFFACTPKPADEPNPKAGPGGPTAREPVFHWLTDASENGPALEVGGLDRESLAGWRSAGTTSQGGEILAVYVGQGAVMEDVELPPMLGEVRAVGEGLRFVPRFPFQPGMEYRAVLRLPGASGAAEVFGSAFKVPARAARPSTMVLMVHPQADVLPENLLKFYLHFSGPMSRGGIYEHIRLLRADGQPVELPFLEIDEELWNPAMTRLTIFIDPGRIKREVKPLEDIGPSLEAGKSYTLVIDRAWLDAEGLPLREAYEKHFRVGPAIREAIDPGHWRISSPAAGMTEPLRIQFDRPMDHALAERLIRVVNEAGVAVAGEATVSDRDRNWTFQPEAAWPVGTHFIEVQTTIEDLAGNNIGKPFEVDLFEGVDRRITNETVRLKVEINRP